MQKEHKKSKQTLKISMIVLIVLILIIGIVSIILINRNKSIETNSPSSKENSLNGTFSFDENVKYEFNNGNGLMYDGDTKYEYTYTINNEKISIDFVDEMIYDATYSYHLEDDTLTLVGEDGTIGGEYILKKEK